MRVREMLTGFVILAVLAGCASEDADQGAAQPAAPVLASGTPVQPEQPPGPAPSVTAPGAPTPSKSGRATKPPASRTASPSVAPSPPVDWRRRIPAFGPPPAAERVRVPENGGKAGWYSRVPTDQPVAFITIDDGWVKRPDAVEALRLAKVPVTMFLTINAIRDNPAYFRQLKSSGATVQAHTITHTKLKGMSYEAQKQELCGSADQLAQLYGSRPTLFRPPYGEKDDVTLQAAHDCGMTAGFFWKQTVDKGIVRYQSGNSVKRGDILLMHFRDAFIDDFIAALRAIKEAGLTPALLDDYYA